MKKQNLKKMAKAITLGLVLGTAVTATSSVWAAETHVKDDASTPNNVFTYDTEKKPSSGVIALLLPAAIMLRHLVKALLPAANGLRRLAKIPKQVF